MTTDLPPVPSDTDRLAAIRARMANAAGSPSPWWSHFETAGMEIVEPVHEINDAEGGRVCVTDTGSGVAALLEHAPADLQYLVGCIDAAAAIHSPFEYRGVRFCSDCSDLGGDDSRGGIEWPCDTARALGLGGEATDER